MSDDEATSKTFRTNFIKVQIKASRLRTQFAARATEEGESDVEKLIIQVVS
jgi:hypothetical protein